MQQENLFEVFNITKTIIAPSVIGSPPPEGLSFSVGTPDAIGIDKIIADTPKSGVVQ